MVTEYIMNTCKLGCGTACCKYLGAEDGGFVCLKYKISDKLKVDENHLSHSPIAQGDNCIGVKDLKNQF